MTKRIWKKTRRVGRRGARHARLMRMWARPHNMRNGKRRASREWIKYLWHITEGRR